MSFSLVRVDQSGWAARLADTFEAYLGNMFALPAPEPRPVSLESEAMLELEQSHQHTEAEFNQAPTSRRDFEPPISPLPLQLVKRSLSAPARTTSECVAPESTVHPLPVESTPAENAPSESTQLEAATDSAPVAAPLCVALWLEEYPFVEDTYDEQGQNSAESELSFDEQWQRFDCSSECRVCRVLSNYGVVSDCDTRQGQCDICLEENVALNPSIYDHGLESHSKSTCEHAFCRDCMKQAYADKLRRGGHVMPCLAPNCKHQLDVDDMHRIEPFLAHMLVVNRTAVQLRHRQALDPQVAFFVDNKAFMPCPVCHVVVERSEGCDCMVCLCCAEFCYLCGAEYDDKSGSCHCR